MEPLTKVCSETVAPPVIDALLVIYVLLGIYTQHVLIYNRLRWEDGVISAYLLVAFYYVWRRFHYILHKAKEEMMAMDAVLLRVLGLVKLASLLGVLLTMAISLLKLCVPFDAYNFVLVAIGVFVVSLRHWVPVGTAEWNASFTAARYRPSAVREQYGVQAYVHVLSSPKNLRVVMDFYKGCLATVVFDFFDALFLCGVLPVAFAFEHVDMYTLCTIQLAFTILFSLSMANVSLIRILEDTGVEAHLFTQVLGSWHPLTTKPSKLLPKWVVKRWPRNSCVRLDGCNYISTGSYSTISWPNSSVHALIYSLFSDPSAIYRRVLGVQAVLIIGKTLLLMYGHVTLIQYALLATCVGSSNLLIIYFMHVWRTNANFFWATCVPADGNGKCS